MDGVHDVREATVNADATIAGRVRTPIQSDGGLNSGPTIQAAAGGACAKICELRKSGRTQVDLSAAILEKLSVN